MDKNKRNRGGRAPTRHRRDTEPRFAFRLLPWLIRSVCLLPAGAAFASPQGGAVIAGQGTIGQPDGSTTVIRQQSNSLAIDWRSFDLAAGDRVRFEQPSSSAAVLNRVLSQRPSQILGSIQANGRVFLINPAGIIFGAGARVNVGSLVASSLGISTNDFMAGNYRFQSAAGQDGGLVVNRGVIQAATGGSVSLIGGAVANQGAIVADYGYVNLGAGRQAVLDFGGDGLMGFQVSGKVLSNAAGVKSAVSNTGTITAGEVVLSGQAAADVFTQAVNNQGVVRAGRIDDSGGTIRLAAAGAGAVNTGTLDASATAAGQPGGSVVMVGPEVSQDGVVRADAASGDGGTVTVQAADQAVLGGDSVTSARSVSGGVGGTVEVLGDKVGLLDQASIDVSGAQGGGTALVGGNARGQGPLPNAGYAFMSSGASIDANATSTGHGGHVVLWSNYATRAYGRIAARGGDAGGDGGLIETSGHYLDVSRLRVNAGAPQGMAGNWLLDPYNVEIVSSGGTAATKVTGTTATWTASTSPTQINASDIVTELQAGTNVTIQTDGATPAGTDAGTITVGAAIAPTMSTSAATLSLDAASDITIQTGAAITASGANPLNVTLSSAGGAITTSSAITTNNGALTMNGGGAVTISANLDAGTGTVGIDSGGSGSIAGTGTITAANVNLQTVSGTGAVGSSSAALKLSAGSGTATTVAVGNGGNAASAAYLDQTSGNLVLGTSNVGGVLKAISDAGAITQSGALTVGGLTTLTANDATNGSIDVSTQANAFGGAVSLNAAHDGKVTNAGNLLLGASNVGGALTATSNTGTITQNGVLTVGGTTTLTAHDATNGEIDVSTQSNAFTGAVSVNTAGAGKVTNAGNLLLGTSNVTGALTATSNTGTITQNGVLTVGGTTSLTANDATNGSVDVSTQSNAFTGAVSMNTAHDGKVTNAGNLLLGASNVGGVLTATSNTGAITQNGVLTVGGTTNLTANDATNGAIDVSTQSNAFTGAVSVDTSHGAKIKNAGNLLLGTSNVTGALSATSSTGTVTQNGVLTVGGTTTLTANDATNGSVDVSTQANAFGGAVSLNTAHDGKVTNAGNLLLGTSNVTGALTATSNTGTVTQNGVLTVGATTALTANDATNGSVDVSTQSNAFGGAVSVNTAGAGKVTNAGNLLLGTSNVTGALSATSNTGTVTQNGVLTVGGTTSLTANDATNGSVDVSTQSNAFTGAVSMNTAHDGKVTNAGNLLLGASNVGGVLTATSNTGAITQNGVLTVGGTTNLTANDATNGAIDVSTQSNGFSGAVSLNTAGAGKVTNSAALVLGASTVGGGLTVGNHGSITVSGPVAAGAGTVSLDTGGSGAITGSGTITAGTVNLQTVSGTGAVGASGGALQLAASTGTGTTTVNVGTATNLVNGVYLNQATGNLDVSSLNLVSGAGLSLTSAGTLTLPAMNINTGSNDLTLSSGVGSLSTVGTLSTTGTLTLSATGGNLVIGHALSSGAMDLTAGGTIGETVGGTVSTTTGALTTSSAGGTTLTGANTVAAFNGTNTGSGDIALTNTAATLDVTGVSQSGGALSVNNTGALQISGAVDTGSAAATLTASGAISQGTAGKVTTGTLTTSSAGGTTLNGTTNAVSAFNGTNSGTGGIALKNTAATLDVTGVSQSGGALSVNNTGALRLTGGVNAGSSGATLTATGAITQSAGTITAGTLTTSSAGGTTLGGANAVVAFNGTNTGSGDISLTNTQALNLTGASQSGGGAVRVANSGAITVLGAVNAGTGAVSLDSGGAGAITGSGTITAGTVNLQTSGGTGAVGGLGNPLQLASSSGSGSTAVNVGQSATPVAGIYLKQTSGNLLLGSLYAGSAAVSISSSGNIDGDGVATHRVHTTGALTLTSTGAGIGAATAVNTALGGAGTLDLSSGGTGSAGAIAVSDDGTMTTGRIGSVKFTGAGAHSLSLGAVSWTVDNHLGSSGNDLSLTASNGGIVGAGAGFLIANNLDLAATGGSIGTPLNTLVGGTLTAQSDTGSIYITNAGALTIGKITAAGAVTLNAGANAITEGTNGLITAGTVNLQTASGSSGAVGSSTAALKLSAGSGTATTVNVGASSTPVNALYLDQTSGNLVLGNTYVGGALAVNTSGALLLGGAVSSQGGALSLTAGTSITQPGTLDSHGGNIAVTADGGGIDLSSGGIAKSEGGNITYKSTGGDIKLGLLDAGTGMVTVDAAGGSILNVNGSTTAANVRAASAALTASQFIGSAASSIVFDIPSTGTIRLQLGAPVAYISNPNRTPVTSTSVVADIASEVANSGARSQAAGLQTVGYVDWSAFSPNLSLFGVNEPGVKLPAGQQDQ